VLSFGRSPDFFGNYDNDQLNQRHRISSFIARLFHDQIIFYVFNPFDAVCDFVRFINRLYRISESAQLSGAFVSFNTDLE
jgi:hypothetical protein